MNLSSRRDFLRRGAVLATSGSGLLLADAEPTEASGGLGRYGEFVQQGSLAPLDGPAAGPATGPVPVQGNAQAANWNVTETNILGPYHRAGAPFRAKITPPLEPGTVLLISGCVWAQDTRQPLAMALIDVGQADSRGRYDNDDSNRRPAATFFKNRARLLTDENGYYEFESIHPGAYQIGPNVWRPPHIHYWVRKSGSPYRALVTQLYFRGELRHLAEVRRLVLPRRGRNRLRVRPGRVDRIRPVRVLDDVP